MHTDIKTDAGSLGVSEIIHTYMFEDSRTENKNIFSQSHSETSLRHLHSVMKGAHLFTCTSHSVIHNLCMTQRCRVLQKREGLVIHTVMGGVAAHTPGAVKRKLLNRTARCKSSQTPSQPLTFLTSLHHQRPSYLQFQVKFYNVFFSPFSSLKSQTVFVSCGHPWKSPVTMSDSPMNNWRPLSVPTHPKTLLEENKCEGQHASIKKKKCERPLGVRGETPFILKVSSALGLNNMQQYECMGAKALTGRGRDFFSLNIPPK